MRLRRAPQLADLAVDVVSLADPRQSKGSQLSFGMAIRVNRDGAEVQRLGDGRLDEIFGDYAMGKPLGNRSA